MTESTQGNNVLIVEDLLSVIGTEGLQKAKHYAKQMGSEGRRLLNAIGLYEGGQFRQDSNKPMHCLAVRISESVKLFEEQQSMEQIVTFLIEGS